MNHLCVCQNYSGRSVENGLCKSCRCQWVLAWTPVAVEWGKEVRFGVYFEDRADVLCLQIGCGM